jgi:hypothetical protein
MESKKGVISQVDNNLKTPNQEETKRQTVDFDGFKKLLDQGLDGPIGMRVDLYAPINKLCLVTKKEESDCRELRKIIAEIKKRNLELIYLYEGMKIPANGEDIVVLSYEDIEWGYHLPDSENP